MSLSEEPDDYGIFYYDGQYLVNYLNGFYMDTNWLHTPGQIKSKMDFRASYDGTLGAYYIVALDGSKGERSLMVKNDNHEIMYRANANNTYCNFWLEYVKEVPVTIGENRWGSTYLPQNVHIPEGIFVAYTVEVKDGTLWLGRIQYNIPAATPVLLIGLPGTYRLEIIDKIEDIGVPTNHLVGTYTTEYTTGNELVWNGETMEKATDEVIWGFTAYMPADSGAEGLPADLAIGISNLTNQNNRGTYKMIRDGHIYIIRNGQQYTPTGIRMQ